MNGQTRLTAMTVAQLDEEQVQGLLTLAQDAGLLEAPPDYAPPADGPQVADAPTTTVTVTAGGGTQRHEAYALGFDDPADGPRLELSGFVDAALAAAADTETTPYEPAEIALFVQPTDLDRSVVDWPAAADSVVLADIAECAIVPAGELVDTLSTTDLLTSFRQDGALYSVSAAEVLPGDAPCTS